MSAYFLILLCECLLPVTRECFLLEMCKHFLLVLDDYCLPVIIPSFSGVVFEYLLPRPGRANTCFSCCIISKCQCSRTLFRLCCGNVCSHCYVNTCCECCWNVCCKCFGLPVLYMLLPVQGQCLLSVLCGCLLPALSMFVASAGTMLTVSAMWMLAASSIYVCCQCRDNAYCQCYVDACCQHATGLLFQCCWMLAATTAGMLNARVLRDVCCQCCKNVAASAA
jgi:hypothetical protein